MYFFTADEHYGHTNIIKYCNRPFSSVEEMDEMIISNHNKVVGDEDITVHVGDFCLIDNTKLVFTKYVHRLKGIHIFLRGSHDRWLNTLHNIHEIWEKKIDDQPIVACHYAMRVWPKNHYNSWLVFGHTHGKLAPEGKSWDVGVDSNNFTPVSFEQLKNIMKDRPDNFNLIKK